MHMLPCWHSQVAVPDSSAAQAIAVTINSAIFVDSWNEALQPHSVAVSVVSATVRHGASNRWGRTDAARVSIRMPADDISLTTATQRQSLLANVADAARSFVPAASDIVVVVMRMQKLSLSWPHSEDLDAGQRATVLEAIQLSLYNKTVSFGTVRYIHGFSSAQHPNLELEGDWVMGIHSGFSLFGVEPTAETFRSLVVQNLAAAEIANCCGNEVDEPNAASIGWAQCRCRMHMRRSAHRACARHVHTVRRVRTPATRGARAGGCAGLSLPPQQWL